MPTHEFLTISSLVVATLGLATASLYPDFDPQSFLVLFESRQLLIAAAYVVVSVISLTIFYQAFREESVGRYELAAILDPLFIFVAAGLAFPAERDLRIYIAAAIALTAFGFAHLHGKRVQFQHGERLLLMVSVLFAIEAVFERLLLESFVPIELFVLRTVAVAVIFTLMHGIHIHKHIFSSRFVGTVGLGVISYIYTNLLFTSYQSLGVTVTNMVLLAGPILMYALARLFFKERLTWKMTLAGAVILATVAYTLWIVG